MDLNRLTRDADDLIRKVVTRYNQLYIPAGRVSQLELDLMLDDLRKLYDTFKTIGHESLLLQNTIEKPAISVNTPLYKESTIEQKTTAAFTGKTVQTPEPDPEVTQPVQLSEVETAEDNVANIPESPTKPAFAEPEVKEIAPVVEPAYESQPTGINSAPAVPDVERFVQNTEKISGTAPEAEPAAAMLADKFSTSNKSLSETIASTQSAGIMSSRLLLQPIADLSTGIGLNDKFTFISELFGNNPVIYEEAINRINKAVNHDEAGWILQKYHSAEWDQKNETLSRLKDFIKRRFI